MCSRNRYRQQANKDPTSYIWIHASKKELKLKTQSEITLEF